MKASAVAELDSCTGREFYHTFVAFGTENVISGSLISIKKAGSTKSTENIYVVIYFSKSRTRMYFFVQGDAEIILMT